MLITFAPRLLYPAYAQPVDAYGILPVIRERWGISPAMDQQIGGLLMWVPGCLVYLTAIMAMFARWYGEEAKQRYGTTCGAAMDLSRDLSEPPLPAGWKKPLPERLAAPYLLAGDSGSGNDAGAAGARDTDANHGRWAGPGSGRTDRMDRRNPT